MRSLRQLAIFVEVVNQNGFAAAARHLKMTPAAVSKQISALEADLGIQLIKRSTHRFDLTMEGSLYLERSKSILEAIERADAEISLSRKEPVGFLKVLCGPHFGSEYVIPHLKEFMDRYPKLHVEIEFGQAIPDLEKEKFDLILGLSSSIPTHCIQRRLISARDVLCASPVYLMEHGEPKKPLDLMHHRMIVHAKSRPNNELVFKNGDNVHFEPLLSFNDTRAMKACAVEGIGIVQLHDYIVADALQKGDLVEILSNYVEQKQTISLFAAYPQTGHVHLKVRKFLDFVLEKIPK